MTEQNKPHSWEQGPAAEKCAAVTRGQVPVCLSGVLVPLGLRLPVRLPRQEHPQPAGV